MKRRFLVFFSSFVLLLPAVVGQVGLGVNGASAASAETALPSEVAGASVQSGTTFAQKQGKPNKGKPKKSNKPKRITQKQREAAAARAARAGQKLAAPGTAAAAAAAATPHYFGPYPNYANSPLPTVTGAVISVGSPLVARAYATDYATPPGELGPVLVVNPTPLPDGLVQGFQTYNQATPGASPTPSAGGIFHAYVLRPTGIANEYRVIFDSGAQTVPATTDPVGQVETFPVPPVAVQAGDVAAFYGQGIPVDTGTGVDILSYPAPTAPLADGTITLGADPYPIYPQARTYSFAASVLDLSGNNPVVTGGIRKFVDGLPGLGAAASNNLGQYIPVAVADTTTYPGSDYYEIAIVQYREKMHSDLPATLLRGYVQLATTEVPGAGVPLTNANLDGTETAVTDAQGNPVLGVDRPHYLGPLISAQKDRPVRILFRNLLPAGAAGDLFLPVDTTVMGSGMGPGMGGMAEPDPQNPMCGQTPKPMDCYPENRATLHLHGGVTPWISDGTPHQWITPASEDTPYPKGVSVRNVPDMPDPGPGAQTFFYTNQQSARMMFYHDHAWGITRLNVYAGEAAGYVISDRAEQALIDAGILPGAADTLPLIIQDKTFVPSAAQLATEDPTWDSARWGGEGNLWVPHVYMPAQNPGDSSGVNQFGRWAYGPWFWPPTQVAQGPIANPYYDPNCDTDTGAWCEPPLIPGVPNNSMGMESFNDTPLVNGTAYPTVTVDPKTYRLRILNAANDRMWNLQFYQADATGTEVALNAAEVAAAQTNPNVFPTPDLAASPAGPDFIQIGTEGGFLPSPVVVKPQPITWVTDPTVFNAGNVDKHSLLLGPAERADTVVDFSAYAGKTLILYNDAPAAFPARDPRYDYYTGGPNLVDTGGAPSTLPGYGPNTRTVMQIKVADTAPAPAYDLAALQAAFAHQADGSGVFESSQDPIIVGQGAYNTAYGSTFRNTAPRDGLVRISDSTFTFNTLLGQGATQTMTMPLQMKAIQDEQGEAFDPAYGRMSGNLGVESPGALAGQQNFVLYPFINPATERLKGVELPPGASATPIASADDGTQIWKITHNGVDTHPIHFHLFDVQVINRVGWDGIIRKVDPNELGWKDTIRISPLEDTILAMRPIIPKSPFGIEDSSRPLDPSMPIGSTAGFRNVDVNGNPITPPITNQVVNFGWEYVWHCHILSHEEMDMMRPISVDVSKALPARPVVLYSRNGGVTLTWNDGTPVTPDLGPSWGDPSAEVGYRIERAPVAANGTVGAYAQIGTALANVTTFTDAGAGSTARYSYRVTAWNAAGTSVSMPVLAGPAGVPAPAAPTALAATLQAGPQVRLVWRDNATNETGFVVERAVTGGEFVPIATPPLRTNTGNTSYVDTTVRAGTSYEYRVRAVNGGGGSAYSDPVTLGVPPVPAAPTGLTGTAVRGAGNRDIVQLGWTDNADNETGYTVQRSTTATFATANTYNVAANTTAWQQTGVARNRTFYYRVRAVNLGGPSAWSDPVTVTTP